MSETGKEFQIDPDGSIFSMQEGSIGHVQNCPTDQQRAQQRAQLETEKREAALREQQKQKEETLEEEKRATYLRTPAGQREQCASRCNTAQMFCIGGNGFSMLAGNPYGAHQLCGMNYSRCIASCSN